MITIGIEKALAHIAEDLYYEVQPNDNPANTTLDDRLKELIVLVRTEAINLADSLIGKDHLLHGDEETLDTTDKAVYDFQVQQRVKLAAYQQPAPVPKIEDLIDPDKSEGEA
jgi:hypothetical protein